MYKHGMEGSGKRKESSLVAVKSCAEIEVMESSFPSGFPVKFEFNRDMESSLEAWRKFMESSQPGIESCPSVFVKDRGLLAMTRNRKMMRSRRRRPLYSRPDVESSQAALEAKKEGCAEPCDQDSMDPRSFDVVTGGNGSGRLPSSGLESDSDL